MKKRLSFIAFIMTIIMMFTLVGCNGGKPTDSSNQPGSNSQTSGTDSTDSGNQPTSSTTTPTERPLDLSGVDSNGVEVRMSVLYDNANTRMRYVSGFEGLPFYSRVENKQYTVNQFKPAWAALQEKQNFKIKDVTPEQAQSITNAYDRFVNTQFNNVDILSGSVTTIVDEATQRGSFVNLAPYIENGTMPYLKKFLDENELVRNTVTSANGEIFYAPYFDGYDDVETMFIVRKDWVEKLLDSDSASYDTNSILSNWYKPFYKEMNTTFKAMKGADDTQNVTLTYGNGQGIIDQQNNLATKNGATLTKALKDYIDLHYVSKGVIEKRSDLFCGQNACYNADEMVALMRCVKTNPSYLTNGKQQQVYAFYPRDKEANRTAAVIQLAQLWGVRGYDSRNSYFYINDKGLLADGRASSDMIEALGFIRQLYLEGLIIQSYDKGLSGAEDYRESLNNNNQGFMTYDYNQTTTIKNESLKHMYPEMNLTPILFPVADWDNKATYLGGDNKVNPVEDSFAGYKVEGNVLYQYTESWRSIKSEAWTISSITKQTPAVLKKCLEIFDYMYSPEGQILMSYGPDAYLKTKDPSVNLNSLVNNLNDADYDDKLQALIEQKYETIEYYDRQVPAIADLALEELKDKEVGQGNYTNYYRYYVGATLPIGYEKEQGMEYQTVDEKGKVGLDYIVNAVEHYVLRHAQVNRGGNPEDGENQDKNLSNSLVPTTFPLTQAQNKQLATACATLGQKFNNAAGNGYNEYHNYIMYGFNRSNNPTTLDPKGLVNLVNNTWRGSEFYRQYLAAYIRMYNLGK